MWRSIMKSVSSQFEDVSFGIASNTVFIKDAKDVSLSDCMNNK